MLDLGAKTVNRARLHINLELHLSVVFLELLDTCTEQVTFVDGLLTASLHIFQLVVLDLELTLHRVDLFFVLGHLGLLFTLHCLQFDDLIAAVSQLHCKLADRLVCVGQVRQNALVL